MEDKFKTISVVIPCFNEEKTIRETLKRVLAADSLGLKKEIIVIDDGSTDKTEEEIKNAIRQLAGKIKIIKHQKNMGKGAAVKTGILASTSDIVLIQDADLEYTPEEYPKLIKPFLEANADVVYGSRFTGAATRRVIPLRFWIANKLLTGFSNLITGLSLTDMETGCKAFRGQLVRKLAKNLRSQNFGIEPEITVKLSKIKNLKLYEVGISYWRGRNKAEGKKIGFADGLKAIIQLLYNWLSIQRT